MHAHTFIIYYIPSNDITTKQQKHMENSTAGTVSLAAKQTTHQLLLLLKLGLQLSGPPRRCLRLACRNANIRA